MVYVNSCIILQKNGLYRAEIRYSYLYFFTYIDHESFKTLGEAKDWILNRRCPEHKEEHFEEQDEEHFEENVFEKDSDDSEYESDFDSDCEETEQQRNVRLNIQYNRSKTLDEIKTFNRKKLCY